MHSTFEWFNEKLMKEYNTRREQRRSERRSVILSNGLCSAHFQTRVYIIPNSFFFEGDI